MPYKYKTLANTNRQNDTEMCVKLGYTKQSTHSVITFNSTNYCVCISMLAVCWSEGHLLVLISPARVESSMLFKASTSAAQVTGCLPLPVSHLLRISVFICTGWFKRSCAIILTLEPFLSSRRKMPNRTYLVAIFHSNVDHHSISACDYFGNCIRQLERKTHTPTYINSQLSSID